MKPSSIGYGIGTRGKRPIRVFFINILSKFSLARGRGGASIFERKTPQTTGHSGKSLGSPYGGTSTFDQSADQNFDQGLYEFEPDKLDRVFTRDLSFEWGVCAFALGIAVYFALKFEPDWRWLLGLAGVGLFIAYILRRQQNGWVTSLAFAISLAILGAGRASLHSAQLASPILDDYEQSYYLTGWIEAVERSGTGTRWRLRMDELENSGGLFAAEDIPEKLRVKTKPHGFEPGDGIRIRAIMSAPPRPVIADGYDPAQRAFFEKVGGYGFAIGTPEAALVKAQGFARWQRGLTRFRHKVTQRIVDNAPQDTAGLQVALLTGERAYIDDVQTEALRSAGLAHVLAISGLHMGLVAGGAYFTITWLLALIDGLARRMDVRRPAAALAMCVATFYFLLSTGTVSIQRAYIMAMVMFAAVLMRRAAISMRSVALAAAVTLAIYPEVLISAGFQMSFAAAAALVSVYGLWREHYGISYGRGPISRIKNSLIALATTSLVAGGATGGFAAMHFNYVTRFGLVGNLLAMPIFSFLVMPMGIAAIIVMPLGLERWPLLIMGQGLSYMLIIANWVASFDQSRIYIKAAPVWAIGIYGLGFVMLCLGPLRKRMTGLAMMGAVGLIWMMTPQADLRISEDGDVAFWDRSEAGQRLYVQRKRADSYGTAQFIERAGFADAERVEYSEDYAACDGAACRMVVQERLISVVSIPEVLAEECANADIVIFPARYAGPVLRRSCASKLIDQRLLSDQGAQDIYLTKTEITRKIANPIARKNRPWGQEN